MSEPILFYGQNNPYGYFSNFSPHPVVIRAKIYPTTEHFFQAMKMISPDACEEIRTCKSPARAKELGNTYARRADWDDADPNPEHVIELVKDRIMYEAVLAKFTQHAHLRERLLETVGRQLIEDSSKDYYWGWGADHSGKNKLGQVLMYVRDHVL